MESSRQIWSETDKGPDPTRVFPSDTGRGITPENYLTEHTVGSIVSSAFKIYFRHFGTLFLIYILPVVPV